MLQQFTIALRISAAAAALVALVFTGAAHAQSPVIADGAPSSYTVQKGDTLWGISGKFLKDPWRWPDVWRMNREEIKNPHRIYPGDVIRLEYVEGQPQLRLARETVQLSPTTRVTSLDVEAIPSIPPGDVEPWFTRNIVTGRSGLFGSAEIVRGRNDARVIRGTGDAVYVLGIDKAAGDYWYIYRPIGAIRNIDATEVLGYESRYLGTARVDRFGELSTVHIESSVEEIQVGDRLVPAPRETIVNYVPRAPDKAIDARILRVPYDNIETGRGNIVTLDKGTQDGLAPGHVLAVYRVIEPIPDPRPSRNPTVILRFLDPTTDWTATDYLQPADERTGLLFVFRTFDRVSFAIVLNTTDPVRPGDYARTP